MNGIKIVRAEEQEVSDSGINLVRADDVKKKDDTEASLLPQEDTDITLDSEDQKQDQPSEYSVTEGKVYTDYPNKRSNQYKFVDGSWKVREKAPVKSTNLLTMLSGPSPKYGSWTDINNQGRIDALNKFYGKKSEQKPAPKEAYVEPANIKKDTYIGVVTGMNLSDEEEQSLQGNKYFTGYPDKEENEYYTKDGEWFKSTPYSNGEFKKLSNEGSIDALNSYFLSKEGKAANEKLYAYNFEQESSKGEEVDEFREKELAFKAKKDEFLKTITTSLIGKEEEEVVKELQDKYGDSGFTFEQAGIGDEMIVKSMYGAEIKIDLDPYKSSTEEVMAGSLRDFLWENKTTDKVSWEGLKEKLINRHAEVSPELKKAADAILNNKIELMAKKNSAISAHNEHFDSLFLKQGFLTDQQKVAYEKNLQRAESLKEDAKELEGLTNDINISAAESLKHTKKRNEQMGTTSGAIGNSILKGVESLVSGTGTLAVTLYDSADEALQTAGIMYGDDEDLLEAGVEYLNYEERSKSRKETIKKIQAQTKDMLVNRFGSATMDEYIASENRGTLMKATQGVAQSIPAMATGFGGMFLQSFDAVAQEWTENPDYEKMPLSDLLVVGGSIAVMQGALEKAGLSSLMSKSPIGKSVSNKILQGTLSKVKGKVSKKKFNDLIKAETDSMIANGVVKIVGGALVEGETGALQEIVDIGVKKIYNETKGKSIFEAPETLAEAGSQVLEAAKLEAIGGALMKSTFMAPNMISKGVKSSRVKKEMVDALHFMADSPDLKRSLVKRLKVGVLEGKITKDEAKSVVNDFEKVNEVMRKIPNNTKDKSNAFDLLIERERIEKAIKGKDKNLVVKQQERIDAINNELQLNKPAPKLKDQKPAVDQSAIHKENGGSSISQTGEDLFGKPGYSVSTHTDKTKTVKGKEVTKQELDQYKKDNKEALKDPNNFVGTWYDSKSDQTYIDITTRVENKEQAIKLGQDNNQKAIFDLESGTEIDTGGTGESTIVEPTTETQPATEESLKTKFKETKGEREQEVVRAAHKVAKSLRSIPGVKIFMHDSTDAYNSAIARSTGESKESIDAETQKSLGEYISGKGEIHINLENESTDATTVYHEAFHAVFEAKGIESGTAKEMADGLKKIAKDKKLIERIDKFVSNYETAEQGEEFMAEMIGILSDTANTLDANGLHKLINLINKIAKKIVGAPIFKATASRQEVLDFINKTATDFVTGNEVDVDPFINGVGKIDVKAISRKKSKYIDALNLERLPLNKNTKITKNFDIKNIDGQIVSTTLSDKLVTGKFDDHVFLGGVGYPEATGYFWAASRLSDSQKIVDQVMESSDGYKYLIPAIMSNTSHMSNKNMAHITMEVFKEAAANKEINKTNFVKLVTKAFSRKKTSKHKPEVVSILKQAGPIEDTIDNLKEYISKGDMTFEARKDMLSTMVGESKVNSPRFQTLGTYTQLATSLAEPNVKDLDLHQVVTVIRTKGNLTAKDTEKTNEFYHESYPSHIESDSEIEVLYLDGVYDLTSIIPEFTKSDGSIVSTENELKTKKLEGWKTENILKNLGRTHGLSKYSAPLKAASPVRKKQVMPKNESEKLTEDKDGNYYFENFAHSKKTTLKPSLATGAGIQTSKEERNAINSVGGLTMLYTMSGQTEKGVGTNKHKVVVPKDKVYYIQDDVNNYYTEAKRQFQEARPGQAFSPNYQGAWITKVANENGYDIAITKWRGNELRAQTTLDLTPTESDTEFGPRPEDVYKVGDDIVVYGMASKVTKVDGDIVSFEGPSGEGSVNTSKSKRSIRKKRVIRPANDINRRVSAMKAEGMNNNDIRSQLKSEMFTDKESSSAILEWDAKEEGIFLKKDGTVTGKLYDFARTLRRKWLLARKFMPKSVFVAHEKAEAEIAAALNKAHKLTVDFSRFHKKYKGDKEVLVNDFDSYIRGDKDVKLPSELKEVADSMRNQVDELSIMLAESGIVDEETSETIKANLGQYLNRSYKVFDRKNWKNEVTEEVKLKARKFLRKQNTSMIEARAIEQDKPFEDVMENFLDRKIDEILTEDIGKFQAQSRKGAKNMDVFKSFQDIPPEIRALMGEYTKPDLIFARTVMKTATIAAHHKFLSKVKETGMGVFLFEESETRPKEFNVKIAADASDAMAPLNGLYTTKEIKEEFESSINETGELVATWMKIVSVIKWSKTIGSVATHAKNVIGNLSFLALNGHVNVKDFGMAYKTVQADFRSRNKKDLRKRMDHYVSLGIVKQSAGLGEIKDMFNDAHWDMALAERLKGDRLNPLQKIIRFGARQKKVLEDAYQAEDDFFKIIAFESELARYAKALYGKKVSELSTEEKAKLDEKASSIVKDTLPTYSRVPEVIQKFRRSPLVGSFVAFTAESYRTGANTAMLAASEINNPDTRSIGIKRLIGATTYMSAKSAILTAGSYAAGAGFTGIYGALTNSDEEEERDADLRKFLPSWSVESDLYYSNVGDGKFTYIDVSAADPWGAFNKVVNAAISGDGVTDGVIKSVKSLIDPFVGTEIATDAALRLQSNTDGYGKPIYNTTDSKFDQVNDIVDYLTKVVEPGTVSSVRRIDKSENKSAEVIAAVTGYRSRTVDVNEQAGYAIRDINSNISKAKLDYNSNFRKFERGEITADELDQSYKKANSKVKGIYSEIMGVYDSAVRLGVDPKKLKGTMRDKGVPRYIVKQIIAGSIKDMKQKK